MFFRLLSAQVRLWRKRSTAPCQVSRPPIAWATSGRRLWAVRRWTGPLGSKGIATMVAQFAQPLLPVAGVECRQWTIYPHGTPQPGGGPESPMGLDLNSTPLQKRSGAGDEARTRDPYLGKVVLYH